MADEMKTTRKDFMKATAGVAAGAALASTFGFNRLASAEEGSESEMITQIARFGLREGKEEEAREALATMVKAVDENEPGVLAYTAHVSEKTGNIVFFEVYKDDAAMKAHGGTPHMRAMFANFTTVFKMPVDIERLDRIAALNR